MPAATQTQPKTNPKAKRLILQIILGIVIFIAISGIVLGLSILFGLLKTPFTSDQTGDTTTGATDDTAQTLDPELFPYLTETYRVEYSGGVIRVYMFPNLSTPGTIDEKEDAIRVDVESWLSANDIDPSSLTIEYRMK